MNQALAKWWKSKEKPPERRNHAENFSYRLGNRMMTWQKFTFILRLHSTLNNYVNSCCIVFIIMNRTYIFFNSFSYIKSSQPPPQKAHRKLLNYNSFILWRVNRTNWKNISVISLTIHHTSLSRFNSFFGSSCVWKRGKHCDMLGDIFCRIVFHNKFSEFMKVTDDRVGKEAE
jgi:hypothetical protein